MRKTINTLYAPGDTVYVDTAVRVEKYLQRPEIKPYTAQCNVTEIQVKIDSVGCRTEYVLKETRKSPCPGRMLVFPENEIRNTVSTARE